MSESQAWTLLVGLVVVAYVVLVCGWLSSGRALRRRVELRSVHDEVRRIDRRLDELDRHVGTSTRRRP